MDLSACHIDTSLFCFRRVATPSVCMQDRSSSTSLLLKQYMQSLQLSASKRKRSGAAVESSSQTSCDYPASRRDRPCSAEARRKAKRKRAGQACNQPRKQSSTRRRACKGGTKDLPHPERNDIDTQNVGPITSNTANNKVESSGRSAYRAVPSESHS